MVQQNKDMLTRSVIVLLFLGACCAVQYGRKGKGNCSNGREVCSCADISRLPDIVKSDYTRRVWYMHLMNDPTNSVPVDAKFIDVFDHKRQSLIGYQPGRSTKTGRCELIIFHDIEVGVNRPCISTRVILPPNQDPTAEWIVTFLDSEKTQLLFYTCLDPRSLNRCKDAIVFAFTSRKRLQPGEKEDFESKVRWFGGPRVLPRGGLTLQRPTTNDCEKEVLEG